MALSEYKKKRKFSQTPEPKGGKSAGDEFLRFVVQKHKASSLHYDFRLEVGGTLKSWAVPKGPSTNPEDKHLAMMVEDHPFDYRNFEGVIPEGNYGAGQVIIWDEGIYVSRHATDRKGSEKEMKEYIKKGHVVVILSGKKLKGEYALIKMHDSKDPNAWLLIKAGDQYASKEDITKQDKSVRSGKTVEELAKGEGVVSAPEGKLPHNVKPMLSTLAEEAFDADDWIFEIKWDGYRTIAEVEDGKVELYSRNLQSFNTKFAPVARVLQNLKHNVVLDGEVVAIGPDGKPGFQALQDYANSSGNLIYYVFDILHLDGHNVSKLPLTERKKLIKQVLPNSKTIQFSDHVETSGKKFFAAAKEQMLEGIMAKRKISVYQPGKRSRDWLKIKTHQRQEAIIAGFTEPRGGRSLFGALVLGVYQDGKLQYIGHTGGGFDAKSLKAVYSKMKPLITNKSAFPVTPKTNEKATWIKPKLVAEVKFQEWTREGTMRQPIFLGLRPDKKPTDVHKELPS